MRSRFERGLEGEVEAVRILIVARRPMRSAVLIRLVSRTLNPSASSVSIQLEGAGFARSSWRKA